MYVGDVRDCEQGGVGESEAVKSRCRRDRSEVATQPLKSHNTCSMAQILDAANQRIEDMQQKYQRWVLGRTPLRVLCDRSRPSFICGLARGREGGSTPRRHPGLESAGGCEFWWRRRRDIVSQFLRRVIVASALTPGTMPRPMHAFLGNYITGRQVLELLIARSQRHQTIF